MGHGKDPASGVCRDFPLLAMWWGGGRCRGGADEAQPRLAYRLGDKVGVVVGGAAELELGAGGAGSAQHQGQGQHEAGAHHRIVQQDGGEGQET